ncbi:MAG TPA: cyclic nucleotide-binding domain-containing protein [Fibrobacteria bacterium]|nr:cyclic nucleotide-binding domain-containing protein [Fibrobacteria bacterium]
MITIRQYAPGEVIVRENEGGETAFLIERGRAEVSKDVGGKAMHVAFLEAGAAFGEMGLVEDSPRKETVTALEETLVREVRRDDFHATMKESPDAVIKLLNNIFERLREANLRLAHLEVPVRAPAPAAVPNPAPPKPAPAAPARTGSPADAPPGPAAKPLLYSIEGLTPRAVEAMSDNPFRFSAFPIKIGRKSNDPLTNNHLEIADQDPLQISRHHVSLIRENGRIGVMDRGSRLGALVDDVRVGGKKNGPGPVFFKGDEGILVLGTDASPYRYRIRTAS